MNVSLPKILITGGKGQVATALQQHNKAKQFQLIACPHNECDITKLSDIQKTISEFHPDIIINTAAYTAVDQAEKEKSLAMQINHLGVQNLAYACEKNRIPIIHLSTDYIFDGQSSMPYTEDHIANPINTYGESKWLGEEALRKECEQHIILRICAVFSEFGNNFFKTILRLAKEKKELRIVSDQIVCPTYAGDIANVLLSISQQFNQYGTFHYCNETPVSWYDFTLAILREAKIELDTLPIGSDQYPSLAERPSYSVFDCSKIKDYFNLEQQNWIHALRKLV